VNDPVLLLMAAVAVIANVVFVAVVVPAVRGPMALA
jgi:hypothetical protein